MGAIALDPQYAYAFCNRGTVLERLERWGEALASYDRALELNPRDAFAYYNRASALRAQIRVPRAVPATSGCGERLAVHVSAG